MYSSISIEGFRCFPRFELHGLSRINLLVGANNSGKTALLEAIALLKAKGHPDPLIEAALRRGEVVHAEDAARADVRRIFHGHAVGMEIVVVLVGTTQTSTERLRLSVVRQRKIRTAVRDEHGRQRTDEHGQPLFETRVRVDDEFIEAPRYLMRDYDGLGDRVIRSHIAAVDPHGGLIWSPDDALAEDVGAQLIPTGSLSGDELAEMLSPLQLTDREHVLREALKIIDDQIENYALALPPSGRRYHSRECVIVKLRGMATPVPIGSLGDGVWRLFTLAVAMASAAGGVVLVDDVDTGLHYSVMEKMWTHIATIAEHLDVQVFATTHSRDCYEALSAIEEGDATIHRIERGRTQSVIFHGGMVAAAAANDVEVR